MIRTILDHVLVLPTTWPATEKQWYAAATVFTTRKSRPTQKPLLQSTDQQASSVTARLPEVLDFLLPWRPCRHSLLARHFRRVTSPFVRDARRITASFLTLQNSKAIQTSC